MKKDGVDEYHVSTIHYDPETEVLLSPFCRNEENAKHVRIVPSAHPNGGCVKEGRICCKEDAVSKGCDTILEFSTSENNGCVFGIVH
jgi:hypothetical protein